MLPSCSVIANVGPSFVAQTINDRDLAPGEGEPRRRNRQFLPLAIDVEESEPARPGREFAGAKQAGIKADFAAGDPQAQFAKAGQHFFLHLAGHPGLLGAAVPGRMRIGVSRERPILGRRLVEADAFAYPVVQAAEALANLRPCIAFKRREEIFLHREQQLRNHVPVDATEALEAEHAPGTTSELAVPEHPFIQRAQRRARGLDVVTVEPGQSIELRIQVADVGEVGIEAIAAVGVTRDNPVIVRSDHAPQQYEFLDCTGRDAVLLEKARQWTVGIQHEGALIGPVDVAAEQGLYQRRGRLRRDRAGAERGDLPLEHEIQRIDADFTRLQVQQVVRAVRAILATVAADAVVDRREGVLQAGP